MKEIRPIDANGLMILLEKDMDMNGITDWGKGYMDGIHYAMEHVKFMPTLKLSEVNDTEQTDEFCKWTKSLVNRTIGNPHKGKPSWGISTARTFIYCPYCGKKLIVPGNGSLDGN